MHCTNLHIYTHLIVDEKLGLVLILILMPYAMRKDDKWILVVDKS